jgi:glutamine amidotransferase
MGNFKSVANMLNYLSIDCEIRSNPPPASEITHLIIPGIGSFDPGMQLIEQSGWMETIRSIPKSVNLLGICLGMQLFTKGSEEGKLPGIGLIDAFCRKFDSSKYKVPHVGWNTTVTLKENNLLFKNVYELRFYFSHSYYVQVNENDLILSETFYGLNFASSINRENIFGLQFHPEKSHQSGMKILSNFAKLSC